MKVGALMVALVVAITACGGGDGAESNDTTGTPPTTEARGGQEGAGQSTPAPEQGASNVSGDLTFAGQSLTLESGCVNTFDPTGTGRVTAQFGVSDGTTLEFVTFPDVDPTVTIVQEGRIWSATLDAPFAVELDVEAGRTSGRGSLVENRTTANADPDETPVAVEFSATWNPADPCP